MDKNLFNRIITIVKKHAIQLAAVIGVFIIVFYFFNIMVLQNKETTLGVLVLSKTDIQDTQKMSDDLSEKLQIADNKKVVVTGYDPSVDENQTAIFTEIRSGIIDLVVANQDYFSQYAEAGTFEEASKLFDKKFLDLNRDLFIQDSIVNYDDNGNVVSKEEEKTYGIYIGTSLQEYGFPLEDAVAGIAVNAEHKDKAVQAIEIFAE